MTKPNFNHEYEEDKDPKLLEEVEVKCNSTKIVDDGLGNNEQRFDRELGYV